MSFLSLPVAKESSKRLRNTVARMIFLPIVMVFKALIVNEQGHTAH